MSMDINSPEGTKVKVLIDEKGQIMNGYDHDKFHAQKHLDPSQTYTVDRTEVHSCHTKVFLKEIPNESFNSVHFYNLSETKETRWEGTEAFVATCNAFNSIQEAKEQLGRETVFLCTIEDINTLQDMLLEQGYSIQKIKD